MSKGEIPLQHSLFSDKLVDNRTRTQKRASGLQQTPMFSIHETFEFGARVRPWLAAAPRPTLELTSEDVRAPEEIEADLEREAQKHNATLYADEAGMYACKKSSLILGWGERTDPGTGERTNGQTQEQETDLNYPNFDCQQRIYEGRFLKKFSNGFFIVRASNRKGANGSRIVSCPEYTTCG